MATPLPVNLDPNPFGKREGEPRKEVVAGSVTGEEKLGVLNVLAAAGFDNMSDGVRTLCFAFRDSPDVRDAVARYRSTHPES